MKEYSYPSSEKTTARAIADKLHEFLNGEIPIVVCIGTDAAIGDSLGPLCGTFIENKKKDLFVYGSLQKTVTAKEIRTIRSFISKVHPFSKVLVIDAAVGRSYDVGRIKISSAPIKPGLGADKDLPPIGDVSIIAIISEKTKSNYEFYSLTRLSPVYFIAKTISDAVVTYCDDVSNNNYLTCAR